MTMTEDQVLEDRRVATELVEGAESAFNEATSELATLRLLYRTIRGATEDAVRRVDELGGELDAAYVVLADAFDPPEETT